MNLMELLLQVDGRLRPLIGADDATLQALLAEVAAGPLPPGVSPDASPGGVLAGQLHGIEIECHMLLDHLRKRLGIELTAVAKVEMTITQPAAFSEPPPAVADGQAEAE